MKRIALILSMLLCLVWLGIMAQGPGSVPVDFATAMQFAKENPQFAKDFTFDKEGKAFCTSDAALAAFNKTKPQLNANATMTMSGEERIMEEAVIRTKPVPAGERGAEASMLESLDNEIAKLEEEVSRSSPNAVTSAHDRLEQLRNERTRLQTNN